MVGGQVNPVISVIIDDNNNNDNNNNKCSHQLLASRSFQGSTTLYMRTTSIAFFITKCDSFFITKCDKCYYKVRQVLQSVTMLLQSATGITKWNDYYKVRQHRLLAVYAYSCCEYPASNRQQLPICLGFLFSYSKNSNFKCPF